MDSAKQIRQKREEYRAFRSTDGIDFVLRHLDTAERHFARGQEGDSDAFTDVVYRTNQVFEGILKEAYEVLSGKPAQGKSPYEIEQYMSKNAVFTERVIEYFRRYRTDWRNASTHDYRLDFDEQEAFLALSTVSAFCFVAIDQMIQELAASRGRSEGKAVADFDLRQGKALAERLVSLVPTTLRKMMVESGAPASSELMLQSTIKGLLESMSPDVQVIQEAAIRSGDRNLRADLLLSQGDVHAILEVKRARPERVGSVVEGAALSEQISLYVKATKSRYGLALVFPSRLSAETIPDFTYTMREDDGVVIFFVFPKGAN